MQKDVVEHCCPSFESEMMEIFVDMVSRKLIYVVRGIYGIFVNVPSTGELRASSIENYRDSLSNSCLFVEKRIANLENWIPMN